ncbi:hypothetical protein BD414DRAFT_497108 [Trametes punicea]|nr:hypothetical protein BD414DRAFT_497108 [Trametes punicea]
MLGTTFIAVIRKGVPFRTSFLLSMTAWFLVVIGMLFAMENSLPSLPSQLSDDFFSVLQKPGQIAIWKTMPWILIMSCEGRWTTLSICTAASLHTALSQESVKQSPSMEHGTHVQ